MIIARTHSGRRASSSLWLFSSLTQQSRNKNNFAKAEHAVRLLSRYSTNITTSQALLRTCKLKPACEIKLVTSRDFSDSNTASSTLREDAQDHSGCLSNLSHDSNTLTTALVSSDKASFVTAQKRLKGPDNRFHHLTPKSILSNYYAKFFQITLSNKSDFSFYSISVLDGRNIWSADFKCPISGEIFSSGSLYNATESDEQVIQQKRVYYSKKMMAIHAACARAIDCFDFRGRSVENDHQHHADQNNREDNLSTIRLCVEEPYIVEGHNSLSSFAENGDNSVCLTDDKNNESPKVSTESEINPVNDKHEFTPASKDKSKEAEEEDYVIRHVSGPGCYSARPNDASLPRTTLDRIFEAWIETPLTPEVDTSSNSPFEQKEGAPDTNSLRTTTTAAINGLVSPSSGRRQRGAAVINALARYRRMVNEIGSTLLSSKDIVLFGGKRRHELRTTGSRQTIVSVNLCNAILNALANVNDIMHDSNYRFDQSNAEMLEGTEAISKQLLDKMLQRVTTSNTFSFQNPNTDTYNAFIRCLRRSTPLETAVAAEQILNDMLHATDMVKNENETACFPPPNVETFNAVMELWSRVPSGNDRDIKMRELYSKLEEQMNLLPVNDNSLRPNRGTFLAALSSLSVRPVVSGNCDNTLVNSNFFQNKSSGFNADEAQAWIDRMEALAEKDGENNSLHADTEMYNAPLPWSGRRNSRSLPLAVTSPWDDHEGIFLNGFRPLPSQDETIDSLVLDATNIENWLYKMERLDTEKGRCKSVAPNIETYESVIQAWVRTGTVEGILRAESWAMRASNAALSIDSNVKPRLQTFHPIIAAWAHSGDARGPGRVQHWFESLEKLSSFIPEVNPDDRIWAAMILAWRKYQVALGKTETKDIDGNLANEADHSQVAFQAGNGGNSLQPLKLQRKSSTGEETYSTFDLALSAAKNSTECLERICAELQKQRTNDEPPFLALDGTSIEHVVNAWGDVAALAQVDTTTPNVNRKAQMHYALSEMMRSIQILNHLMDVYSNLKGESAHKEGEKKTVDKDAVNNITQTYSMENDRQLCHLMYASYKIYTTAVSHVCKINTLSGGEGSQHGPTESNFAMYVPHMETMIRRSMEHARKLGLPKRQLIANDATKSFDYDSDDKKKLFLQARSDFLTEYEDYELEYCDTYSYERYRPSDFAENNAAAANLTPLNAFYNAVLQGCKNLSSPSNHGDVVRISMCVLECMAEDQHYRDQNLASHDQLIQYIKQMAETDTEELINLYISLIFVVGGVVPDLKQRKTLISRVYNQAMSFRSGNPDKKSDRTTAELLLDAVRKNFPEDNAEVDAFLNELQHNSKEEDLS